MTSWVLDVRGHNLILMEVNFSAGSRPDSPQGPSWPGFWTMEPGDGEGWLEAWTGGTRDGIQARGIELDAGGHDQSAAHGLALGRSQRIRDRMESPWAWEPSHGPHVKKPGVRGQDRQVQAMLPRGQRCDSGWAGPGYRGNP